MRVAVNRMTSETPRHCICMLTYANWFSPRKMKSCRSSQERSDTGMLDNLALNQHAETQESDATDRATVSSNKTMVSL